MTGSGAMREKLVLRNDRAEIVRLIGWIDGIERRCALPARTAYALRLCLEEIAVNFVSYGCDPAVEGVMEIEVRTDRGRLEATFRDTGRPFDPLAERASQPADRAAAPASGFGLALVRHFASRLSYQRAGDHNLLTLSFE